MGMMHEGYFVGRKELTAWIQQNFDPSFQKVEELASGVVYCQILHSICPGAIPMNKLKAGAKTEVDYIHNFKLLQKGFATKKIDRHIDVGRLTKRSFQYNMEFLQFMKTYWDMHAPPAESKRALGSAGRGGGGRGSMAPTVDPRVEQLELEVTDLKLHAENLERERDFYYEKLREVEILCQSHEAEQVPFLQEVLQILYKMDDSEEFAPPEEGAVEAQ